MTRKRTGASASIRGTEHAVDAADRRGAERARVPGIAGACDAAARADWKGCLTALLDLWRVAKTPEVAELIDRVTPRGSASPPSNLTERALSARIGTATDADIGPLLETMLSALRTKPRMLRHILELAARCAPDPRISKALVTLVRYEGHTRGVDIHSQAMIALHQIDDPRYRAILSKEWGPLEMRGLPSRRIRPELSDVVLDPAAIAAGIEQIDAALQRERRHQNAADMLEAIYDNPLDTALRLVYADAAQEAGDPRGEFVALQCARETGPASARERALLAAYGRRWLGAIEPVVRKQGVVYRRGFPACVREHRDVFADPGLLHAREWRTIEELDTSEWDETTVDFLGITWPALRRVWGVRSQLLPRILDRVGHVHWTTLGLARHSQPPFIRLADAASALPALIEIDLTSMRVPDVLDNLRLPQLRRLRLRVQPDERVGEIIAQARGCAIPELELVPDYAFPDSTGECIRISGTHLMLISRSARASGRYAAAMIPLLPGIQTASIEAPAHMRVNPRTRALLQAALATHKIAAPSLAERQSSSKPERSQCDEHSASAASVESR